MLTVRFYEKTEVSDELLKFSVIAAKHEGRWIFCRHKKRSTWEIPGGHREPGESTFETAKRELHEETGAVDFDLSEVCIYGVDGGNEITYGMLYFAEVRTIGLLPPEMEIGEITFLNHMPKDLTYPAIQPYLFEHIQEWLNLQSRPNEL